MTENVEHYRNQIALARTEIKNLRQQLSSLKHEHLKEIKAIKEALSELRCANCADSATTVQRNLVEQPSSSSEVDGGIAYRAIGVIETSFQNKRGVPRQPSVLAKARGAVVIDPSIFNNPEHALSGLEEFSHMWIIFHFHATESSNVPAKVSPPRLGGERRGVFATRSPHRPCPIGLSLVKIQSIEGNRIYFFGVDMVNGTPVLDIKPYIPQYDYPVPVFGDTPMSSLVRPPTEGTSDGLDVANLQLDDSYDSRSLSPRHRQSNPIGDTSPAAGPPPSTLPVSPSPDSPSSVDLLDGSLRSPIRRPDTERGAPDGQERFTPPQSTQLVNLSHDGIRVAPWIANPPTQTYDVRFTDDALSRLVELIGDRAQAFKNNLISLLSEDPRSNYVRTRYPDHEYNCVLEDLSISCVFDVASAVCTIIAVRNADDLQN
ncbi:tRNA (adenine(37)-N6)-methyltransferase isoform X1 [Cydia splendana]|uniref:tRNA (adenine(37)-N6)-methyltransferase isoform X1 n=1 Tax=Cydia splendana TaxID=1100963 RepID=UPI0021259FE0